MGSGWVGAVLLAHSDSRRARNWRPVVESGLTVFFAGYIDNARQLAFEQGVPWPHRAQSSDLARLYAIILRRHGNMTDQFIFGQYAAAVIDEQQRSLRLVRSPLSAPPLQFRIHAGLVRVASVVRVLLADDDAPRLDPVKMADNAWFNDTSGDAGWYQGIERVPLGSTIEFSPGSRADNRFYDLLALPEVNLPTRADYVKQAKSLLNEAVAAAIGPFERPAILLSGGLDSSLVAAAALEVLPAGQSLPAFTFVPQDDWDGRVPRGTYGDERPFVEALANRFPRIEPHFIDNRGLGFDHRMAELFHLTGIAPINLANVSPYHEAWRAAQRAGCDMVLMPEWGNDTFSNTGSWGLVEYFVKLRWGELGAALRGLPDDPRPLWRRFVGESLLPLLPPKAWHYQRRLRRAMDIRALASPLRADYVRSMRLQQRAENRGPAVGGATPRSKRHWLATISGTAYENSTDVWQGFEQLYGIPMRDPALYRPLAEFCFGLPTDLYLHKGVDRWLAREMGRGILPEEQRTNRISGRHNADWLVKLAPRRAELSDELERLAQIPELAAMIDFPRLRAALADWPAETPIGEDSLGLQIAVTRGITAARFINYVSGRNC